MDNKPHYVHCGGGPECSHNLPSTRAGAPHGDVLLFGERIGNHPVFSIRGANFLRSGPALYNAASDAAEASAFANDLKRYDLPEDSVYDAYLFEQPRSM